VIQFLLVDITVWRNLELLLDVEFVESVKMLPIEIGCTCSFVTMGI
jgi:hypothetical protein